MNPHILNLSKPYPELQPVTIAGHAFFTFSLSMNHRLTHLEKQFESATMRAPLSIRNKWTPLPNRPR